MDVAELRERLRGLPDDLPVVIGDDYDERAWDWLQWVGEARTLRPQALTRTGSIEPAGARVVRLGFDPPKKNV